MAAAAVLHFRAVTGVIGTVTGLAGGQIKVQIIRNIGPVEVRRRLNIESFGVRIFGMAGVAVLGIYAIAFEILAVTSLAGSQIPVKSGFDDLPVEIFGRRVCEIRRMREIRVTGVAVFGCDAVAAVISAMAGLAGGHIAAERLLDVRSVEISRSRIGETGRMRILAVAGITIFTFVTVAFKISTVTGLASRKVKIQFRVNKFSVEIR